MSNNLLKELSFEQSNSLINTLKNRFEKNHKRHKNIPWNEVENRLEKYKEKLWSLYKMELTGGEPDVVDFDEKTAEFIFYDCSSESPIGRRSLCYDKQALDERKENKPLDSAINMAETLGINLLSVEQYKFLQNLGDFDLKTSSWIQTPDEIRKLGGALFCDRRYNTVFLYHNGAQSYYAARGFRGMIRL